MHGKGRHGTSEGRRVPTPGPVRRMLVAVSSVAAMLAGVGLSAPVADATLVCQPSSIGTERPTLEGATVNVFDSLAQLLPSKSAKGAEKATVCQAGNAYESVQLEISNPKTGFVVKNLKVNSVKATNLALTGGGAEIPSTDVQLYREEYVTLETMTDGELLKQVPRDEKTGHCPPASKPKTDCRFPDALIPAVDPLFGEVRNAFPIEVPAGEDRAVWVDIFVPKGQAPGLYTGKLTLETSNKKQAVIEVAVQVIKASLPATPARCGAASKASACHSAFFLELGPPRGLTTPAIDDEQYAEYAVLGLNNRISIVPGGTLPEKVSGDLATYLPPLFEGTDKRPALSGAELTDYLLSTSFEEGRVAQYKSLFEALKGGRVNRVSAYCDEIPAQKCAEKVASRLWSEWPGLPVLATVRLPAEEWPDPNEVKPEAIVPNTKGAVNLETATRGVADYVGLLEPNPEQLPTGYTKSGSRMPALAKWRALKEGRQVWAYTACASGGCEPPYSASLLYNGWPSYGIDQVATEQRAMGWQMFINELDGEQYWAVNKNFEIWTKPYGETGEETGMNGDGTLFYPWQEARVGGKKPFPVESIRLKRIRDGHEDYELLEKATELAGRPKVLGLAKTRFPNMYKSAPSATSFDATRRKVIELIH
jgi:Domain of unknown function (DUF4091)